MNEIPISAEDKEMFEVRVAQIQAHRALAIAGEKDLYRMLRKIYKLAPEEKWELDLEGSVLRNVSANKSE